MPDSKTIATAQRRRRRSGEEVARRILEAAAEEFELAGFAGATTAAIARRAEVTEAQIFRLYGSKQDLFKAAIFGPLNEHFGQFMAQVQTAGEGGDEREVARAYIGELQDFIGRHSRMFMSLVVAATYSPEAVGSIGEMAGLRAYFEQGAALMQRRVGDDPKVSPDLMVRVSFAAVLANLMFRDWLFPADASDAQLRDAIAEFVLDGITANGPVGLR